MKQIKINKIIKFLFQNQKKIRVILFVAITVIMLAYGVIFNPIPLVKMYIIIITPALLLVLLINLIAKQIGKKKHWIAKTIKYLLYFTKYSFIFYFFFFLLLLHALSAGLNTIPFWDGFSIMVFSSILSLLLL